MSLLFAGYVELNVQNWTGKVSSVKWHRSLRLNIASPELSDMRNWLRTAREACNLQSAKDVSKLMLSDLMQEIASVLSAAGVPDTITQK